MFYALEDIKTSVVSCGSHITTSGTPSKVQVISKAHVGISLDSKTVFRFCEMYLCEIF